MPLSGQIIVWSPSTYAYQHTKFQLPSWISFRDTEEIPKFNVGLLAPCRIL